MDKVKLLLDTGSDISIVNEKTCKKIGCPPLRGTKKNKKITRCIWVKLNSRGEFSHNIWFMERTLKSKVYVLPDMLNLFGTDWIVPFHLWELIKNSICKKSRHGSKGKICKNRKIYIWLEKWISTHIFWMSWTMYKNRGQVQT